jgi:transcriptional regulator with XRE-family HTH domain
LPIKKVELVRLGRRIRERRRLMGLTQGEFAAHCGLNKTYFGEVERGNRNITFGILCAICDGLACDIAAITIGIPKKHGLTSSDRRADHLPVIRERNLNPTKII